MILLDANLLLYAVNRDLPQHRQAQAWLEKVLSDYVRDVIRRDQEYQNRREILVKALIAGENSGISELTPKDIWRGVTH